MGSDKHKQSHKRKYSDDSDNDSSADSGKAILSYSHQYFKLVTAL